MRVWSDGPSTDHAPERTVRGIVRHVREGRETMFASWEELRALLVESWERGDLPQESERS